MLLAADEVDVRLDSSGSSKEDIAYFINHYHLQVNSVLYIAGIALVQSLISVAN